MPIRHAVRPLLAALLATTALVAAGFARAQGLPTGGQVVSGGVAIGTPRNGGLTITQSSQTAIVNWQGFSIGQGNRVEIRQPDARAAILNRVTGETPSTIAGQLDANGQVYLVNPNGVTITRTGQVNAGGGFTASTLDIADEDFKAGRRQFRGAGASAAVANHGRITVARGGYAALIGGQVSNTGTITVPMGKVGLGSGERATLDLSGDGFLQVEIPTKAQGQGALVSHSGTITAEGGAVTLSAAAARDMARQAVNLTGTIEARAVGGRNGSIVLSGSEGAVSVGAGARLDASGADGEAGGRVRVSGRSLDVAGTVDVSGARGGRVSLRGGERLALSGKVLATGRTGQGGRVTATAPTIETHAALIDASGATQGGTVHLGGGRKGEGRLAHADTVTVDADTAIRADATERGAGGDVVVWSDVATRFAGTISARGGAEGGDGGQAEVSSRGRLAYEGTADLRAPQGAFGTLLLDPYNLTISSGTQTTGSGFTATGNDSVVNATTLQNALATANVEVSTGSSSSSGSQAGTITVAAGVRWSSGSSLTLTAANALAVNAPITVAGGGQLVLNTGTTSIGSSTQPLLSFGSGGSVTFASGQNGQALTVNGTSYTLLYDMAGVAGLNGKTIGAYALTGDLTASASYTDAVAKNFSGTLEGLGHTITGLTINAPTTDYVGLIGSLKNGGAVRDIGIVGGSIKGNNSVGGLVGSNSGTVTQAYATGTVSGSSNNVGGLVGSNFITISQAYATGTVSGSGTVGGLVGYTAGTVMQAYATGAVSGSGSNVGGLAGINNGTVAQAYAIGAVSGSSNVGGLVGDNFTGKITQAYATGAVSGSITGGLVGGNGGTVASSYWDTQTSGQTSSSGGGAGLTTAQFQSGSASGLGSAFAGGANGLYPYLKSFFPNGVQAVTGTAYRDAGATPAASGSAGAVTVSLDAGGKRLTQTATTGANGAYYIALPTGTLADGSAFVASVPTNGSLSKAAATLATASTASPAQTGIDLYGGALTMATTATTLSAAPDLATARTSANAAAGAATQTLIGPLTGRGLIATGSGFTIDQAVSTGDTFAVRTTAPGAGLTVAQPITIAAGGSLGLSAAGALAINADLTAKGAATVALAYDRNTTTPAVTDLSFAQGRSLSFVNADGSAATAAVTGQALTVNGTAYTLLYTMADVVGLDGKSTAYALAGNLTASASYTDAVAKNFSGTLEGLGHTITGLTINALGTDTVGLIGTLDGGTVRDIGIVGGSVSGRTNVGGLVGANGGTVTQAYATGAISGSGNYVGGLVGYNGGSGMVTQAHATGAVSGAFYIGGLVGYSEGTVTQAYATGAVSGSGDSVGGLVGYNKRGTVQQAYATGAVSGSGYYVGGLVGGTDQNTITQSYWDTQTSGQTRSAGGTGLTTAQFQSGGASGLGSAFAGGTNGLYPYLKNFFPDGVQAVTGTAQAADGTAFGAAQVGLYSNGSLLGGGTVSSGANGYVYQAVAAGTLPISGPVRIGASLTPKGGRAVTGLAYTDDPARSGSVLALGPITAGQNRQTTARTLYSDLSSDLAATFGTGTLTAALAATPPTLTATGSRFTLDQALAPGLNVTLVTTGSAAPLTLGANLDVGAGNTLTLKATGAIDQTGGTITAGTLTGSSGGATSLTRTGNAIATLGPFSAGGALSLATAQALTLSGTVSAGQSLTLASAGALTLASGAQARATGDIALAASGAFVNDAGSGAVTSSTGRWLIYSATSAGDTFGSLDSGNTAVWNTAAGGTVAQTGNRYVFAEQPTLTVTTTDRIKTYGQDAATAVAGAYALTGLRPAVAGAYRADTAATAFSGTPLVTSTGSGAQADVAGSPYAIVADLTGLTSPAGYALSAVNNGHLTVTPATLTVTGATGIDRTYDGTTALPAGASGFTVSGVLSGDAVSLGAASAGYDGANAGSHAVLVSGLALTGAKAGNYALSATSVTGSGTIDPAALTITAGDRTKTYGQTLDLGSTGFTAAGLIGTDAVAGVVLSSAGTAATADVAGGPYAITAANAQGTGLANYAIAYRPGALTITPATLTVTGATGIDRTYDGTTALPAGASGFTVSGVLSGDAVSLGAASAGYDGASAGRHAVLVSGLALTGAKAGNYALSANSATGSGTIDPATLTYTADAATRTYGAANPTLTGTVLGFVNGESLSGATSGMLAFTTAATPGSDVGRYAVTGSGLTARNGNYVFVQAAGNATALGITPAPITVTANSGRSVYGDSPVDPGWSVTGLQNGQGVSVLTGLSNGFGLDAATAAGRYALAVDGTPSNGNYVITARNAGSFIIDPRPITITADAQTRLYGDANPSLTYTVGGRGLVDGDALTGALATTAIRSSGIGSYAITQGTLAASPNYAVSYRGAVLTVAARPITPTVDTQPQASGGASPTPISTVAGRGLGDGDTVSGGQPTNTTQTEWATANATVQESSATSAVAVPGPQADRRAMPTPVVSSNLASTLLRDLRTTAQPAEIILTRTADGTLTLRNPSFDETRACLPKAGGCFAVPLRATPDPQARAGNTPSAR